MTISLNPSNTTQRRIDPISSPLWSELVTTRRSSVFHSPQWMEVLRSTYGLSFSACVLERAGTLVGGIPWCDQDGLLGGRRISLAFSDFCGPLAETVADSLTLAEAAQNDGLPWVLRAKAADIPDLESPIAHQSQFKWQGIRLEDDEKSLWNGMVASVQRGVAKARRSKVELVQATCKRELREWYLLHLRLRKFKHQLLAQPYKFFESIWDIFIETGQGSLLLAIHQGQIIGGTLYLFWQDTCYYKFNASDAGFLKLRPNNLMLWQGMLDARERGCSMLDLGRSPLAQKGLIHYKRNFGAVEEDLFSLTYESEASESPVNVDGHRLLQQLTEFFVRESVPDNLSEEASNLLYQYFA